MSKPLIFAETGDVVVRIDAVQAIEPSDYREGMSNVYLTSGEIVRVNGTPLEIMDRLGAALEAADKAVEQFNSTRDNGRV